MALKQITSAGSPYNLTVNDFSPLLNIPYCLLIASGGGAITVNLPTVNSLNKFGKVLVICADGITSVTLNADVSDAITESGSISMSKTVTGNKNFLELEAATYVSGNIWLGSTNGGSGGGGGGGGVTSISYSDLMTLAGANNLTQGASYLITDFQTVTYIQYSGGGVGNEDINVGAVEPMIVQAATSNSFAANIISTAFPTDEITWKATFADRDWDAVAGQATGVITSRHDTVNYLYRDYDWRNVVFRRWETVNGSGIYDSYLPTAFAFQDYPPFPNGSFKATIGSPLVIAPNFGAPYQLDNTVPQTICAEIDIHMAYANNFLGVFFSNIIQLCAYNTSDNFNFNLCISISSNQVTDILSNRCTEIVDNVATEISDNIVTFINNNSVADKIINNISNQIIDNISSIPNSSIADNNVIYIQNNVDFEFISENTGNRIDDNTRCKITENSCRTISANIHQTVGQFIIIDSNSCEAIVTNNSNSAGDLLIGSNSLSSIANNTFENVSEFFQNNGTVFNNNSFAVGGGTTFRYNVFGNLENNTINVRGVNKNTFNANISGKVFTPTVSMDSANPSLTLYDTATADVEQILTAGVLVYAAF